MSTLQEVAELLEAQNVLLGEIRDEVSPAILPKVYQKTLRPTAAVTDKFELVAHLRAPHTKYFTIVNNSVNIMEIQFLQDAESTFTDILQPLEVRRFDLDVDLVYARQRPISAVTGQIVLNEFLRHGAADEKQSGPKRQLEQTTVQGRVSTGFVAKNQRQQSQNQVEPEAGMIMQRQMRRMRPGTGSRARR